MRQQGPHSRASLAAAAAAALRLVRCGQSVGLYAQELLPLMLAGALSSSARFTVILRPSTTLLCRALITPLTTEPSLNSQKP